MFNMLIILFSFGDIYDFRLEEATFCLVSADYLRYCGRSIQIRSLFIVDLLATLPLFLLDNGYYFLHYLRLFRMFDFDRTATEYLENVSSFCKSHIVISSVRAVDQRRKTIDCVQTYVLLWSTTVHLRVHDMPL